MLQGCAAALPCVGSARCISLPSAAQLTRRLWLTPVAGAYGLRICHMADYGAPRPGFPILLPYIPLSLLRDPGRPLVHSAQVSLHSKLDLSRSAASTKPNHTPRRKAAKGILRAFVPWREPDFCRAGATGCASAEAGSRKPETTGPGKTTSARPELGGNTGRATRPCKLPHSKATLTSQVKAPPTMLLMTFFRTAASAVSPTRLV